MEYKTSYKEGIVRIAWNDGLAKKAVGMKCNCVSLVPYTINLLIEKFNIRIEHNTTLWWLAH